MKSIWNLLVSSVIAGACIGIGGTAYLKVGGIAGAVLFTVGLVSVVAYKLKLYTGTAGFVDKSNWATLFPILFGNIIGCILVAMMPTGVDVSSIIAARAASGIGKAFVLAIGCGFLMTTAVKFARQGNWLPLLFAVPAFIMCGFYHCVADAFYYAAGWRLLTWQILPVYIATVLGNFVGCNIPRLIPE